MQNLHLPPDGIIMLVASEVALFSPVLLLQVVFTALLALCLYLFMLIIEEIHSIKKKMPSDSFISVQGNLSYFCLFF